MAQVLRHFQVRLSLVLALSAASLTGCNSELREVCTGKYDHTLVDARAELSGVLAQDRNDAAKRDLRSLASAKSLTDFSQLTPEQQEHWQKWSEDQLKRIEAYIDWAKFNRDDSPNGVALRRELTDMANNLVAFHGYSADGRLERMMQILTELEAARKDIQARACSAS